MTLIDASRGRCHQLEPADKGAQRVLYQLTEEMDKRGGRLALVLAGKLMNPADDPG